MIGNGILSSINLSMPHRLPSNQDKHIVFPLDVELSFTGDRFTVGVLFLSPFLNSAYMLPTSKACSMILQLRQITVHYVFKFLLASISQLYTLVQTYLYFLLVSSLFSLYNQIGKPVNPNSTTNVVMKFIWKCHNCPKRKIDTT